MLEAYQVMANEMKDKVKKKYYRRVLEKSVGNKIKYWECFQNISREEAFLGWPRLEKMLTMSC